MKTTNKPKEIDEMNFEELIHYIGVKRLPRNSFKPEVRKLSPAQIVRKARRELEAFPL